MARDPSTRMRRFWDDRARENAAWYVDTSLDYGDPDMRRFFENGELIVSIAYGEAPRPPARHDVALEIGPGLGRVCRALQPRFDHVIGVDVSAEMLDRARELVPGVDFRVGDGVTLPVDDESVDFVVSFTVLQHLPSADLVAGYVREAVRVARPGGVLALQWNNLPHPGRWKAKAAWWRLRQRLHLGLSEERRTAPEFAGTRVPWSTIERVLADEGVEVLGRKGEGTLFAWVWAVKG